MRSSCSAYLPHPQAHRAPACPSIILLNQCAGSDGRTPIATIRDPGILPVAVRNAVTTAWGEVVHSRPSSNTLRTGAKPCARLPSDPRHRTAHPSAGSQPSPVARCPTPSHSLLSSSFDPMNRTTCSNAIRACSNDDATNRHSPPGTINGPSNVAHDTPGGVYDKSVVALSPQERQRRRGDPCGRPCGATNACVRGDGTPQGRPLRWPGDVWR